MSTKIRPSDENLTPLNFGIAFFNVFLWINLLLLALLFEKGLDTIIGVNNFNELKDYKFSILPIYNNITWAYIIYSFLLANYILFVIRYLFWTPWPIFNRILDLSRNKNNKKEKKSGNKHDILTEIKFNKLIYGISNVTDSDVRWSSIILVLEAFIAYMGITSLGNIQIVFVFIILLPIVDLSIPFISSILKTILITLLRIKFRKKADKTISSSKPIKHSYTVRKWLLPTIFLKPNAYDILIPIVFIGIAIIVMYSGNYKNLSFFSISLKNQMIFSIVIAVSMFINNILIFKTLKIQYFKALYILFKLRTINDALDSKNRPEAYKKGSIKFMDLELKIDERVYPPTPETSFLVEKSIELLKMKASSVIIDVGTGSANIAICIANKFPTADIRAIDFSNDALDLAKENLYKHKIKNIKLVDSDLLAAKDLHNINNPDLIVANLPYGSHEYLLASNKEESIPYMPSEAVFPKKNGLIGDYIELVKEIINFQWKTTLLIETGPIPQDELINEFPQELLELVSIEYISKDKNYSILKIIFSQG